MAGIDAFTKLMLHCDGTDASTTFTDSSLSPKTMTARGNAQIDTAQFKFGTASGLFDGTGDFVDTPDSADFTLGSGNFTIDFWFRTSSLDIYVFGQMNSSATATTQSTYGYFEPVAGGTAWGTITSGSTQYTATRVDTNIDDGGWHHYALIRNGNNLYVAIDGTLGTATDVTGVTANDSANKWSVGSAGEFVTTPFNGWIDEFRLSVGIARWTANFTPPTSAYSAGGVMRTPNLDGLSAAGAFFANPLG